jgi:hypothetical protein
MSTSRQSVGLDSPTWGDVRRRWANFAWDLRAFRSLLIARFIVWRALRRKRKAAAAYSEDLMVARDDNHVLRDQEQEASVFSRVDEPLPWHFVR